jgi:hypothetical protein
VEGCRALPEAPISHIPGKGDVGPGLGYLLPPCPPIFSARKEVAPIFLQQFWGDHRIAPLGAIRAGLFHCLPGTL